MADKKISELVSITGSATAADDYFVVVDTSGAVTYKISREELNNAIEQDVLENISITNLTSDLNTNGNDINFGDNDKAIFGAGSDLELFHDGSHSYIKDNGTGNLKIIGSDISIEGSGETYATFVDDGAVTLYHDNAAKIATTSTGVDVTGTATVDQLNIDSVGAFGNFDSKATISTESAFAGSDKDFRVKTTAGNVNHFIVQATTGNVGIATSSPLGGLQIGDATVDANNKIVLGKAETSTQGFFPVIQQTSSDGAGNDLTLATTSGNGVLRFFTGNTNNNAVIGTLNNAERMRILSSGGITFNGDTAAANALDDYEEGTWTPEFQATITNFSSVTYNSTQHKAYYIKVGNIVHITLYTRVDAFSGGSGNVRIAGLPFNIGSNGSSAGGAAGYIQNWNSTFSIHGATLSTDQIYLHKNGNNTTPLTVSDMRNSNDSNQMSMSFSYRTS